ncbi:hypothetical protein PT300_08675 [Enterobacteriaceae bacterium ESL0689]|nr:hypothetical protein [Enterobacteriaceae bacterium ESL0689]
MVRVIRQGAPPGGGDDNALLARAFRQGIKMVASDENCDGKAVILLRYLS